MTNEEIMAQLDQLTDEANAAEDAGYISGELVRAVGEGATAYLTYRQCYTPPVDGVIQQPEPGVAATWWAEFFNAAMDAVVERPEAACGACEPNRLCAEHQPGQECRHEFTRHHKHAWPTCQNCGAQYEGDAHIPVTDPPEPLIEHRPVEECAE